MKHEIMRDIKATFKTLREINMKLNPKKCTFGIGEGTILGYKLNGKLASLNRFLSKSAKKSLPFFKTLKECTKKSDFQWTMEAEVAFKQIKKLIAELPTLTAPMEREELIVYLAAVREAVSAVLMMKRETKQMSVYFVSRALQGPEINYTPMEKLVLALVHASKRLKRYFHAHTIIVITDQPIKQVLSRPEVARRLHKWSIELGEYDVQYRQKTSVKGQILADFIVESSAKTTSSQFHVKRREDSVPIVLFTGRDLLRRWFQSWFDTHKSRKSIIHLRLKIQVPRSENKKADALRKMASTSFAHLTKQVRVEELNEKSINEAKVLAVVDEEGDTWTTPIYNYLTEETLPAEKEEARAIRCKSGRYAITNGHASRNKIYGSKGHTDGILLADNTRGCKKTDKEMSRLLAGPFPEGPGKVKFLILAMDYFTKWIEAKPVATITGNQVKKFVWDNIVCKFGLLGEIISDNIKQFRDNPFKNSCEKLCIRQRFASFKHPQANGLVERANRSLGEGIKAHNGDTPFSLTYETEAVIPTEIGMPTLRSVEIDMVQNDEALEINLDLLEERKEQAAIRKSKKQGKDKKILQL
ncbi:reverse transcriptase domain-containing protein [Tanacetum coccineum]